ncbi:hypothetical protein B0A48_03047 [Cryoendolithus antarcticus]|uniref:Conserved oligomeric Golgi complex subunit 5 n=1 Tax=Cryoendolithus antarcticus TaxID=1507870 RepID=A0A1V8TM06_9PEZI|nr:hypothetical protein B0A48_03047 [Cryoendolithus antarcticus]
MTSYLDTAALLSPTFTPTTYANTLVLATNNPQDSPLDLSTPLSRVLFDVQEVDTRIDTLATQHADAIIGHTASQAQASGRVLEELEERVKELQESYGRLEREVGERHEQAEQVRLAAKRMSRTLRLGRSVQRVLGLGRQLQSFIEQGKGSERGMVQAANTVLQLREVFAAGDAKGLGRVQVVSTLRNEIITPAERTLLASAQQVVREFSMSALASSGAAAPTYRDSEATKTRTAGAVQTLWLLSPTKAGVSGFTPTLQLTALSSYLQTALTASLASLTRALATLPTLDRTLQEIASRCQNIIALESLLSSTQSPAHPSLPAGTDSETSDLLEPLLRHLDTSSLPSYFWRSLASQLSGRVQEIMSKGGVSARTLRSNRDRVREAIRECVETGSRAPAGTEMGVSEQPGKGWEREAAVMVAAVVGPLGR